MYGMSVPSINLGISEATHGAWMDLPLRDRKIIADKLRSALRRQVENMYAQQPRRGRKEAQQAIRATSKE